MMHAPGFLPTDLQIVSEADLLLLQRETAPRGGVVGTGADAGRSAPWPEGALDSVLDELERREVMVAGASTPSA
ncbi:hypothetical protein [Arthrobacter sp. NPDC092385]|uniref:hypothetical protein n=1 Tax=Arthrobacter sp. NPDC092385 TaxID=3363943 RepID=UPI003814FCAC